MSFTSLSLFFFFFFLVVCLVWLDLVVIGKNFKFPCLSYVASTLYSLDPLWLIPNLPVKSRDCQIARVMSDESKQRLGRNPADKLEREDIYCKEIKSQDEPA